MKSKPLFDLPQEFEPVVSVTPSEQKKEKAGTGRQRFKKGERHQVEFFEGTLDELVPQNHPVRSIDAWVDAQDLSELTKRFRAVEGEAGATPFHPGVLLKLWIFATLESVGSARELSSLLKRDNLYRWLAGGLTICHRVLSAFRVLDGDFLEGLLTRHVADLMNTGLVTMQTVAQDGMRVRANAGKSSFHRQSTLEALEAQVQEQLQVLREELDHPSGESRDSRETARRLLAKDEQLKRIRQAQEERAKLEEQRSRRSAKEPEARASTTDPEARTMKMANGGYNPAFNVQYVTDASSKVIVSVHVTNQGTDAGQAGPALEIMSRSYSPTPDHFLADGGFATRENVDSCAAAGTTPYMPVKERQKKIDKGLDPTAPQPGDSEAVKEWRKRMELEEAKALYKLRCETAELVNAQTRNHGFQQMPVRGLRKARCVALLHALTHNIQRDIALKNPKRKAR